MKKRIFVLIFGLISFNLCAQVYKDIDGDGIKDSIYIDTQDYKIVCKLSTKAFVPMYSKPNLTDELNSGINETKKGFAFFVNYMRAGYAHQFKYDTVSKRIRLVGMSRYELGSANNDGSGNSSVNLSTNNYIGEWNYYDLNKNTLIKIPTIKCKMYFTTQFLEEYDGSYQSLFEEKCSRLYHENKNKLINN